MSSARRWRLEPACPRAGGISGPLRYGLRAGRLEEKRRKLPREDNVLLCPGVHLLTMGAGQFVILEGGIREEIFIDRETGGGELRRGRASD